jgi:hypothetical protein
MLCFASVFMCFHCVFTAETCTFGTFYMYIPKYTGTINSTWNIQFCLCFDVFSLCFHCFFKCRNMYFWYIAHVYRKTNVLYILHEMHSFSSIFIYFHWNWNAEPCTFGTLRMYIPKYTCTIILHEMHSFASFFMCFNCRNMYF